MKSSAELQIGDLAAQFGLGTHVLRHWEAMGLLAPAQRVNGRRRYTQSHAIRVMTILRAKSAGMSLEQIRDILVAANDQPKRHELLEAHHAELERRLAALSESKTLVEHLMECTADDYAQCPGYRELAERVMAGNTPPSDDDCVLEEHERPTRRQQRS
ncbi:MerR family transcriptional regulator [Phytoactinopolyspora limicola]|uniref:MerR family transcriptional regulator n=1 Tax=Phytoactinopolyspora limicola TaxID=2715536 RepID=UPI00140C4F00|nr:MerR family transcriptional regulator [Phytoactinopolyspora limicola]